MAEPEPIPSRLSTRAGSPTGCRSSRPRASGWRRRSRRRGRDGRRADRARAAQLRSRHRREDRGQRGDGGLPARVPAGGDRGGRGHVRRRLRPPRRLGHHQLPLAALHRQRARRARASTSTAGAGVFGPGWRANATIGRALRLIVRQPGRGRRPGVVSMSTMAHPGRYTYCIGEHEEESPWDSLAVEHGFAPGESTVARLRGRGAARRLRPPEPHGRRTSSSRIAQVARGDLAPQVHAPRRHPRRALARARAHHRGRRLGARPTCASSCGTRLRKPVRELDPGGGRRRGAARARARQVPAPARPTTT